jgi:hypothetical protein
MRKFTDSNSLGPAWDPPDEKPVTEEDNSEPSDETFETLV